jgi:hypothetical protein
MHSPVLSPVIDPGQVSVLGSGLILSSWAAVRRLPTTYYNRSSMTYSEQPGGRPPMASETEPGQLAQLAVNQLQVGFADPDDGAIP